MGSEWIGFTTWIYELEKLALLKMIETLNWFKYYGKIPVKTIENHLMI